MGTSAACIPFLPGRQGPTALLILRQRPAPSAVLAPNSQTCTCVSCGRDQGCPFALCPRSDPDAVPYGSRSTLSRHPPAQPASARCPYAARTVSALPALDQVSAPPVVLILHSDAVATQLSGRVMPFRPLTPDSPRPCCAFRSRQPDSFLRGPSQFFGPHLATRAPARPRVYPLHFLLENCSRCCPDRSHACPLAPCPGTLCSPAPAPSPRPPSAQAAPDPDQRVQRRAIQTREVLQQCPLVAPESPAGVMGHGALQKPEHDGAQGQVSQVGEQQEQCARHCTPPAPALRRLAGSLSARSGRGGEAGAQSHGPDLRWTGRARKELGWSLL